MRRLVAKVGRAARREARAKLAKQVKVLAAKAEAGSAAQQQLQRMEQQLATLDRRAGFYDTELVT